MAFCDSLLPVVPGTGFRMDGSYVWCGSAVEFEGRCWLFAARWDKSATFPAGYMTHSEIVLAVSDSPEKPFSYVKTLLGRRDGGRWDSLMAHNPFIARMGDAFVLFYIGSPDGRFETRKIGYAVSDRPDGEWIRSDEAIALPDNANNPAVVEAPDGGVFLYFRDGCLRVSVAHARRYDAPFTVLNDNLFPRGPVEDMFVWREGGRYRMLAEDGRGRYTGLEKGGVLFVSDNGVDWECEDTAPAYGFTVPTTGGGVLELQRRERPFLLDFHGNRYLFTAAKTGGETRLTGGDTWNMVQKLKR